MTQTLCEHSTQNPRLRTGRSKKNGSPLSTQTKIWANVSVRVSQGAALSHSSAILSTFFCTWDNCSLIGWQEMKTVSTLSGIISFSSSLPSIERSPFISRGKLMLGQRRRSFEHQLAKWREKGAGSKGWGGWQLRKMLFVSYHNRTFIFKMYIASAL